MTTPTRPVIPMPTPKALELRERLGEMLRVLDSKPPRDLPAADMAALFRRLESDAVSVRISAAHYAEEFEAFAASETGE